MASFWDRLKAAINPFDNGAGWSNPNVQPQPQRSSGGVDPNALAAALQGAKYGKLADPQFRNQWLQLNQPTKFNLAAAAYQSAQEAPKKVAKAVPFSVARSGLGTAEGFAGLYDLLTPGTGTNRVTKGIISAEKAVDRGAKRFNIDPAAYRALQGVTDAAQFLAPSATFETLNKGGKVGKAIVSTNPLIKAKGLQYLSTPANLVNAAVGTVRAQGNLAARGQDVSPTSVAQAGATNLALGAGLNAVGKPVLGLEQAVAKKFGGMASGIKAPVKSISNAVKDSRVKPDVRALQEQKARTIAQMDSASPSMMKNLVTNVNDLDRQIRRIQKQSGSVGPDNSSMPTIKNVFGEEVPNPNYKGDQISPENYAKAFGVTKEQAAKDLSTPTGYITAETKVRNGKKDTVRVKKGDKGLVRTVQSEKVPIPEAMDARLGDLQQPATPVLPSKEVAANTRSLKEAKPEFMDTTNKFLGTKEAAKTQNLATVKQLPKLDNNQSLGLMEGIEQGVQSGDFGKVPAQVRGILDAKYAQLKQAGVDIGYLQDYFPHKWQNATQDQVNQAYQTLNLRAGIQNPRTIPTIQEGIQMGFKPLTSDYREAINNYLNTADKLLANRSYFNELKGKGLIAEAGNRPAGMQVIDAPGLPTPRPFVDPETGTQIQGNYYAKPDVARELNKMFGEQHRNPILKGTAATSQKIQQLTLAGGLPSTPLNAFGTANWLKQSLGGQPISATKSFFRSFSPEATDKFFNKNLDRIKLMQENGVNFRGSINDASSLKSLSEKIANESGFAGKERAALKEGWDALVEDPTFQRLLPSLQLDTFNKAYDNAISKGMKQPEAAKLASEVVRNFNGQNSLAKQALKSRAANDTISTFFFAPTFREQMANFWVNNLKALGKPTDPAYRQNLKFMAGASALFASMQAANYALNGHSTFQNDNPNDRLSLSIPREDGKSVAVPFLSSIATVPRTAVNVAGDLVTGKPKEAGMEAKKFASQLVRPFIDLATNQKYNGRQIYSEKDPASQRLKDQAGYFAGQYNHPYIQAGYNAATGKSSGPLETASTALELPLRFRNYDSTVPAGKTADDPNVLVKQAFNSPEGKKFIALTDAQKKDYAKQSPDNRAMYDHWQAMKKALGGGDQLLPAGLDQKSTDTLNKFDRLTKKGQDALIARDKNAEYDKALADYNKKKADGSLSTAEDIKAQNALKKLQVQSKFDKSVRDLYSLSASDMIDYVKTSKDGKNEWNKLVALDKELVANGYSSKLFNKNGSLKGTKGGGGGKSSGVRLAKLPSIRLSKPSSVKMGRSKRTKFASVRAGKAKKVKFTA